ncbi:methionyl-tRNA formyltransferase [Lachnotalea sp. AF33-28]|uniref:methionyl-tRNA formyltransferase n=1 Tax=Lachnotalea sp. AF33-28 TaxID=2292046 RepID=UPI000E547352|nr:methionyl-tRNA formyltransferase [Lachnotalea sp. AF33-28]RHP29930.1 methionyl-tRNA formyltransferase [Lachnotalea sp. AF33-28]
MRAIFMGTPDFAVPALEALVEGGHEVAAVITQPDKPKGRSGALQFPPVKEKALAYGLPVYQPVKVKDAGFLELLESLKPDVIIVAAYGRILPKTILDLPVYGCINVHASLLPKYRGAAPIQQAILDGETQTGVTTMYMAEGIDTGDILLQTVIPIAEDETGGSLFEKLSKAGGPLLLETLKALEEGTVKRTPQTGEISHTGMLSKASGLIDWNRPAAELERMVRGLNPWPSAYTSLNGKTLKIWEAAVIEGGCEGQPGEITGTSFTGILIQTGQGILEVRQLQLEGKKRMDALAFLRGHKLPIHTVLG